MLREPAQLRLFVLTSPITAWIAGLLAFGVSSIGPSGHNFSGGDLGAILIWAGVGVLIAMPAFFCPALLILETVLGGRHPLWAFPLVGAILALPMTCFACLVFGSNPLSMATDEFVAIFSFFAAVGVVVGFAVVLRPVGAAG